MWELSIEVSGETPEQTAANAALVEKVVGRPPLRAQDLPAHCMMRGAVAREMQWEMATRQQAEDADRRVREALSVGRSDIRRL